jgi:cbb3-type cytochrome oxidase maturation protein
MASAVAAFFWAVRNGQFDDLESPAWRILMDDDRAPPQQENQDNTSPK